MAWQCQQKVETREEGDELMELITCHVDSPSHNSVVNHSMWERIHLRLKVGHVKALLKLCPNMRTFICGARLREPPVNVSEPDTPGLNCLLLPLRRLWHWGSDI